VAEAECAVAAAKRQREKAQAAWEYAREQASNPHRIAQLAGTDRWAAWDKEQNSNMDACGMRRCAAERAVGDAEMGLFQAQYEAKEARIELTEYEEAQREQAARQLRAADEQEKWSQIAQGLASNNAMCTPDDPEYWEPDADELLRLHSLWKL
jgi:hypothetical protein